MLGSSVMAAVVNQNYKTIITSGEPLQGIPSEKLESLLNPEILMQATTQFDPAIHLFLRDSLGTSINHGYFVGIAFAVIGFLSVLNAGPGQSKNPKKDEDS